MAGRGGYNTKTRQLILDYLINNRQHAVSASNILEHLEAEGASPKSHHGVPVSGQAGRRTAHYEICGR